jgi:photosystem II stability/assembly factor-like uncharacterized protein
VPLVLYPLAVGLALCGCISESSTDLGHWSGIPYCTVVGLEPDPANPGVLYAAVDDPGGNAVYKSSNGGDTWIRVLASDGVFAVALDRARTEAVYAVGDSLHVSHDFGGTWQTHEISFHGTTLAVDSRDGLTFYAGSSDDGLFRSTDEGVTWVRVLEHGVRRIITDHTGGGTVFAATHNGLYRSADGGATWERSDEGVQGIARTVAMHPLDSGLLYCGCASGVFRSQDGGETWTTTQLQDTTSWIDVATSDPNRLYASHLGHMFTSRDGGLLWDQVHVVPAIAEPTFSMLTVRVDPTDPAVLYLATDRRGVLKSYDGGESWEFARYGLPHRSTGGGGGVDCAPTNVFSVVMLGLPAACTRRRWWRWLARISH